MVQNYNARAEKLSFQDHAAACEPLSWTRSRYAHITVPLGWRTGTAQCGFAWL
jgi:hypothetical protein